jgi:hypothetical protein
MKPIKAMTMQELDAEIVLLVLADVSVLKAAEDWRRRYYGKGKLGGSWGYDVQFIPELAECQSEGLAKGRQGPQAAV